MVAKNGQKKTRSHLSLARLNRAKYGGKLYIAERKTFTPEM